MANDLSITLRLAAVDKVTGVLDKVNVGSKEAAQALKATRDRLRELNNQQKALDQFRETTVGLRDVSAKFRAAEERVQQLGWQMNNAGPQAKQFAAELEKARQRVQALSQQQDAQRQKLRTLGDGLRQAGVNTSNLSAGARKLKSDIASATESLNEQTTALTRQNTVLQRQAVIQKRVSELREHHGRTMGRVGGMAAAGAGGMGTGYALAQPLGSSIRSFSEQETAAAQLKASVMVADGSVPESFREISALAQRLGDRLPGTTADFYNLMTVLKKEGMSDTAILGGLGEAAAYLGVQLQMPTDQAGKFAAQMQDATRATEGEMMQLMDVIQRAYYMGTDSDQMLAGFSKMSAVLPILREQGAKAAATLAPLLVMMNQSGMNDGASAGNAIRKMFQSGLDEKKVTKANKALAKMKAGFQLSFVDKKGNFAGLDNLFAQLEKLSRIDSDVKRLAIIKEIFGDDAENLQVVNTMMAKGLAGYREVMAKMKAQADLQQRVASQLQTMTNLWEAATGAATNASAAITATVEPEIKKLIRWLNEAAERFSQFVNENPKTVAFFFRLAAVIAAVSFTVGALMIAIAGMAAPFLVLRYLLALVGIRFLTLGAMAGGFFRTMFVLVRANPLAAAIIGIGVAIASLVGRWSAIKGFFDRGEWGNLIKEVGAGLEDGLNAMTLGLYTVFKGIVLGLVNTFKFILGINSPSTLFYDFGVNIVEGLINGITAMFGSLGATIKGLADSTIGWFREKLGIRSPSRVFVQAGQFIGQGAALGMENTFPMLRATALGLAGATAIAMPAMATSIDTRPALTSAMAATGRGGAPITIQGDTITIQITAGPGTDPQALARAIGAELDRREAAKHARMRGRFTDFDN